VVGTVTAKEVQRVKRAKFEQESNPRGFWDKSAENIEWNM